MSEALWIEHVYKRRYAEWQDDLAAGSAKAMCMLACLIWRRDGRDVSTAYADLLDGKTDFDLQEMIQSMTESVEAARKEAEAEAGQDSANPTPAGSAPDGTRSTATAISPSSPASSTSGRSKSGSSTSRTSKR